MNCDEGIESAQEQATGCLQEGESYGAATAEAGWHSGHRHGRRVPWAWGQYGEATALLYACKGAYAAYVQTYEGIQQRAFATLAAVQARP